MALNLEGMAKLDLVEHQWPRLLSWHWLLLPVVLEVPRGHTIPPGYWVAWRLWDRDGSICMPIPLCYVVGWLRWAWIEGKHRLVAQSTWEAQLHVARPQGRSEARTELRRGYDRGFTS